MTRVYVICEGLTEITFVREVLQRQLPGLHFISFQPGKCFGHARGGDIRYARVKPDIMKTLKQDSICYCTTFLDYYRLGTDFPRVPGRPKAPPQQKAAEIEEAMQNDIAEELGVSFNRSRFFPYLSMHEFEGLLFSDPCQLANSLGHPELACRLEAIRKSFLTPEHIDDDPAATPSKRLLALFPGYDKATGGNIAALQVGLSAMERECEHFANWMRTLRGLE